MSGANEDVRGIWDQNARWWDERMGEGNRYVNELIMPATERLLALQPEERVLEAACGNGVISRRLAALGASVLAFDFSEKLIELARARTSAGAKIEYRVADATDITQLIALGEGEYDAAVCSMALMDISDVRPLLSALATLLKPGGRFVFSVPHPCFNSAAQTTIVSERRLEGRGEVSHTVKIGAYITPDAWKGEAIAGQPELQYYFHRPLSVLFSVCFDAGFALDGLEEPTFSRSDDRDLSWKSLTEIPPVLVARMKLRTPQ